MAARMPMMIMTTRSSMRVKPSSRSSMLLRMRDSIMFLPRMSAALRGSLTMGSSVPQTLPLSNHLACRSTFTRPLDRAGQNGRVHFDQLAGRLLLATPGLVDPNFSHAVVLVLAHSDDGALGVVLNRPGGLPVEEVLPRWAHLAAAPRQVFLGGPVQPDTALCLGATPEGWRPVDVDEDPETTDVSC